MKEYKELIEIITQTTFDSDKTMEAVNLIIKISDRNIEDYKLVDDFITSVINADMLTADERKSLCDISDKLRKK